MIAFGVIAALMLGQRRWEARGGNPDEMSGLVMWGVIPGLIGARIYHVATDWPSYQGRWIDSFKIWQGGLGIPGGLLLGVSVGYWYARQRGWDIAKLLEAVIPGIPVAQAIGRLGNWFNQEIFGKPTSLPWAVEIDPEFRPIEFASEPTFQPMFLYEGLWNLALAGFLILVSNRKLLKPNQILPLWIMGYGIGRFLLELMRTDFANEILGLRVNTWVSGAAILGGGLWFVLLGRRSPNTETEPASGSESDSNSASEPESGSESASEDHEREAESTEQVRSSVADADPDAS